MAKKKVFVSFDYETDLDLKEGLVAQAKRQDSPFSVTDVSLQERAPEQEWVSKAQRAIAGCDVSLSYWGATRTTLHGSSKKSQSLAV